jgi:hypothetical protein
MKAIIEKNDGLHIIRIYENKGSLCDVFVVEDIELKKEIRIRLGDEKLIDTTNGDLTTEDCDYNAKQVFNGEKIT